jgi:hypothetical protein
MVMELPGIEMDNDGNFIRLPVPVTAHVTQIGQGMATNSSRRKAPFFYCFRGSMYLSTGLPRPPSLQISRAYDREIFHNGAENEQ